MAGLFDTGSVIKCISRAWRASLLFQVICALCDAVNAAACIYTAIVQCQCVPVLPCLLCIEVSLGKNIDKVNCNSKGSLPAAEINRIPCVKTVSALFVSLSLTVGLTPSILVMLPGCVEGKHADMFTVPIKRVFTGRSIMIVLSRLAGK